MKTRILTTLIMALLVVSTFAQGIENDDMYFNSKDRAKLKEQTASQVAVASARRTTERRNNNVEEEFINPTDSYSARTINPEYSSRSNAEVAQADDQDYFINNYQYQTAQNLNNWNNNFNNWYGNSWYRPNYYSPSIYGWNSPYYGSHFNAWGNPWNDPYYRGAWSSSFSYHWGNNWNYGWGGMNAWNYPMMNSWGWGSGWGSAWGPSMGMGFYGYNSWYGNPRNIVVVNNNYGEGRTTTYGKRPSRSSTMTTSQPNTRSRTTYTSDTGSGRNNQGGRTGSTRQEEYYNKSWRYTAPNTNTGSNTNNNTNTRTRTSSYSNDSYNTQRSSGSNNSSYSPSRSSSPSSGSGTRSSAPSQSGGSQGRTRGGR